MAAKIVSRGDPIEPIYLNNLRVAAQDWGYDSGLAVTQKGAGANMSVDVSAGGAWINDTRITKGSITNVVITAAHATYDRYDLIVINSSGTISAIDGTAAAVSYANDYDLQANNAILLSEVYVPATDTTIEDAQITDQRIKTSTEPAGIIKNWHGLIANIPAGHVLCDGTDSTPDMREKFVRGAPDATEAGTTGGADTHTLVAGEMPEHHHNGSRRNASWHASGSSGAHLSQGLCNNSDVPLDVGGDGAHNNMPAYYELLFIMKT